MKILVVDDSRVNRLFIQDILEKHDHKTYTATNGFEALVQVAKVMPDVIILDAMMPEMDGYETCRFITNNPDTRDIPVVFVTSLTSIEDLVKAFDSGAMDFVRKPPNELELVARIHSALRIKKYQDKLKERIIKDGLTDLYTHSYFISTLEREFYSVRRYHGGLGLVLFDLDDFKKINDTYGHIAGDRALLMVARIFLSNIRKTDIPSRYGGEEFALITTHTSLDDTTSVAQRIREEIQHTIVSDRSQSFTVTISCGVTMCRKTDTVYNDMIRRADRALYEAKHKGKNCVVVRP
jgi:two-component system cell cycle response regulator